MPLEKWLPAWDYSLIANGEKTCAIIVLQFSLNSPSTFENAYLELLEVIAWHEQLLPRKKGRHCKRIHPKYEASVN